MSGNIQFGIKVGYDGAAIAGGARANAEQIKAIGATAEAAGTQASRSLDRTAISARQTAAALRGVPAQFTDIFTSIAAGQNPMQVFLQQGGQLKDMFGGAGPAARALGAYIVGLVNPATVAGAAIVGLAAAYEMGRRESEGMARAIIMSGNAAGTTVGQMQAYSRTVADATGATRGAAADALTQLAATGKVSSEMLGRAAETAVRLQRVGGPAIDDTVSRFAELGKSPVEASLKLSEQTNYLTAAVYRQIKALQDQGDIAGASALAQGAYAEAAKQMAEETEKRLGALEKAWRGLGDAAGWAIDKMKGIGREDLAADLAAAEASVTELRDRVATLDRGGAGKTLWADFQRQRLRDAEEMAAVLRKQVDANTSAATAKGEANKREAAGIGLSIEAGKYITRQVQMTRELEKVETLYAKAIAGTANEKEKAAIEENRRAAIAGIRDRFGEKKTTTRDGLDDAAREQAKSYAQQYESITQLARGIEAEAAAGEKLLPLQLALAKARGTLTEAQVRQIEQDVAGALLIEARTKADREAAEAAKIHTGYIQSQLAPLEEHALKLEQEVSTYGMTVSQIESVSLARLQEARDIAAANDAYPEHLAYLDREIKARQHLVAAAGAKETLDANKKATEEMQRDWKRMHEQLSQSLTDQLMEGGHSAGELLENYFRTLILRPVIQGVVNIGMNAVGSTLGFSGAGGAGGAFGSVGGSGGIGDLMSMGSSASNLFGGGTSAYTAFAMSEAGTSLGLSTAYIDALGIGEAVGGTALSALGTALPYIGAALAVATALGVFDGGGEDPHNNTQLTGFELGLNRSGAFGVQNSDATGAPSAMSAGPTSGEGWWADSANLSAEQLAAINAQVTASFAQGHALAKLFGVDPSVIDAASVDSRYNGTAGNGHIQGYFSTMDQAFAALSDQIVKAVWPDVTKYQQAGKSVTQTLTDNISALDAFNAGLAGLHKQFADFNNQLDLGAGSTLDPLSKYRTARGIYDTAIAGTDSAAAIAAAKDFLQISRDVFSSSTAYATDYGMVKTALAALESTLTTQASANLPDSLKALQAAMPSHAAGLSVVPYDGYMATLHRDEAVIDAGAMGVLRRYGIPVGGDSKAEAHAAASVRVQQAGFQLLADKLDAMEARLAGIERVTRLEALAA